MHLRPVFALGVWMLGLLSLWVSPLQAQFRFQNATHLTEIGANDDQEIQDVATLSNQSRIAVGHMAGTVDFDPTDNELLVQADVISPFVAIFPIADTPIVRLFSPLTGSAKATRVAVDDDDNVFVVGTFSGELAFGDGLPPIVGSAAGPADDHFLVKLQPSGTIEWAIGFAAPQNFAISAIDARFDRVVMAGQLRGTVDFDPGPAVFNLSSLGGEIFVASYQTEGSLQWALLADSGNAFNAVSTVSLVDGGSVLVGGTFGGTVDFDPGSGEALLNTPVQGGFVVRYDSTGALEWARLPAVALDNTRIQVNSLAAVDQQIFLGGSVRGTINLDSSQATEWLLSSTTPTQTDHFVAEYDAAGLPIWSSLIDGDGKTMLTAVAIGPAELRLVAGYTFNSNIGLLSFSSSVESANHSVRSAGFLGAYTPSGEYQQSLVLDSNASTFGPRLTGLSIAPQGQVQLGGHSARSFDADPGPQQSIISTMGTDAFLLSFELDLFNDSFEVPPTLSSPLHWGK